MSDADRALAGLEQRRREAFGIPIHATPAEDFTPLPVSIGDFDATPRELELLQVVWLHTANMELRSRARLDNTEASKLCDDLGELNEKFVRFQTDLTGASGTNGKLGNLRKDVDDAKARADKAPSFVKRAIVLAAGSIIGALGSAILYVRSANESASAARAAAAAETATIRARLEASDADRAQLHEQLNAFFRSARVRAPSLNPPGDLSP